MIHSRFQQTSNVHQLKYQRFERIVAILIHFAHSTLTLPSHKTNTITHGLTRDERHASFSPVVRVVRPTRQPNQRQYVGIPFAELFIAGRKTPREKVDNGKKSESEPEGHKSRRGPIRMLADDGYLASGPRVLISRLVRRAVPIDAFYIFYWIVQMSINFDN